MNERNWTQFDGPLKPHRPVDLERLLDAALAPTPGSKQLARRILAELAERADGIEPQLRHALDVALAPPPPPAGLTQRILDATSDQVPTRLTRKLDVALEPEPVGEPLKQRIVAALDEQEAPATAAATAATAVGEEDAQEGVGAAAASRPSLPPYVAGRIRRQRPRRGLAESWRYAAAAAVVAIYGAGLWMSLSTSEPTDRSQPAAGLDHAEGAVSFARVQQEVDQVFDRAAFPAFTDRHDREMDLLTLEIEQMLDEFIVDGLFTPQEARFGPQLGLEMDPDPLDPSDMF